MAFAVFADGSANLPHKLLEGISLLPNEYTVDGIPETYSGDVDHFDGHAYYEMLRSGRVVQTSMLNPQVFLSCFAPVLKQGLDIIYIAMSSGISGTYNAAVTSAKELMAQFTGSYIHVVDSLGCGFGHGMLAIEAARLSRQGMHAQDAAEVLDADVPHICQYFTVDDLNFLKRTGRVSGFTATLASVLNIKPILYGDSTGHIVSCSKARGRRKSIEALLQNYREKRIQGSNPEVFISHGDCPDDALTLSDLVKDVTPDAQVCVCQHEPFSGAHVGPGMLGLFFRGVER